MGRVFEEKHLILFLVEERDEGVYLRLAYLLSSDELFLDFVDLGNIAIVQLVELLLVLIDYCLLLEGMPVSLLRALFFSLC